MARKPAATKTTAEIVTDKDTPGLPAMVESANALAVMQTSYNEDRDLVNQLLGQAQIAGAFEDFSRTVRISKLAFVKENKLYRQIEGMKLRTGAEILSGTWEEFCGLLGRSVDQVDRDIANLRTFGEEALESMSRMGIGYRELRQFRRLPDDEKTALIEVAKEGDKESFLELAEDLIAKHAKEKEALSKRAEEAESNIDAQGKILKQKDQKINEVTRDFEKLKKHVAEMPPADVGGAIRAEASKLASVAEVNVRALRPGLEALAEHAQEHGIPHDEFISGLFCQIELALKQLRGEFGVKTAPDGNEEPEWIRELNEAEGEK